jgi:hypothetical protein
MLLVIGNRFEIQEKMGVRVKIGFDESKQLDFIHGLIKEILVV